MGKKKEGVSDWARARKAREEAVEKRLKEKESADKSKKSKDSSEAPYEPEAGSPLWDPTPEEQRVKLPKPGVNKDKGKDTPAQPTSSLKAGAFTIDTNTSFLDTPAAELGASKKSNEETTQEVKEGVRDEPPEKGSKGGGGGLNQESGTQW